jgi:hypothetical protein
MSRQASVLEKFVAKATLLKKSAKSKPVNDRDSDSEVSHVSN